MTTPEVTALQAGRPDARGRFDAWLERSKRAAGSFSVRVKILGIILAMTVVVGLVMTWQARAVVGSVLVEELDHRGVAMADELAAEAAAPILLDDTDAIRDLLSTAISDHPDAVYAIVIDSDRSVVASSFGDDTPPNYLPELHPADDLIAIQHLDFQTASGSVHEFRAPILDGTGGIVRLGLSEARLVSATTGVTRHVVIALIWSWIYNPRYGLINSFLFKIGVEDPPGWLADKSLATWSIIAAAVWRQVGYVMILYLAGLKNIDPSLIDASKVDGANSWQRFRHVVLPLLAPVTTIVVVISVIDSLRTFDLVQIMTRGGPANASSVLANLMYIQAFNNYKFGLGAATAVVLFFISLFFIVIYLWRVMRDELEY